MNCYVINLASETARMGFMEKQLSALDIPFERFEAVTCDDPLVNQNDDYWNTWERPLQPSERACALSHLSLWKRIAENSGRAPFLILEDDALLAARTPEILCAAQSLVGVDYINLEVKRQKKTVSLSSISLLPDVSLLRLYLNRSGAAAYLLWPAGARKLVENAQSKAGLADAIICRSSNLASFQIEPAGAIQLEHCQKYGITPPIVTCSSIQSNRGTRTTQYLSSGFRYQRVAAQFKTFTRLLRYIFRSERREIEIDQDDFLYNSALPAN